MLLRRVSDKEIMGWKKFLKHFLLCQCSLDKNASPYPLNSSQSCHRILKGLTETQPMLPGHPDPFIFLLPTNFLKPHLCCLLTCNVRKTCHAAACLAAAQMGADGWDDRFLSTHGYPGMAHSLYARLGSTGGYGKWAQTLWSLKRTGSVRKVSTPHSSIVDPLTIPQIYTGEWFLSTKPSLHAPQQWGSGMRDHCLPPCAFLPPIQSCSAGRAAGMRLAHPKEHGVAH